MLRLYGAEPVIKAILEDLQETSKGFGDGAIIHLYIPIIEQASKELEATKMNRFLSGLALMGQRAGKG